MPVRSRAFHDPVNEVFDHGADLVEAAAALRDAAAAPGAGRAAPAVLGCTEAALRDLAEAMTRLGVHRDPGAACAVAEVRGALWAAADAATQARRAVAGARRGATGAGGPARGGDA